MKRTVGVFLLAIAMGMLLMLFISNKFVGCIIIALLFVLGYYILHRLETPQSGDNRWIILSVS